MRNKGITVIMLLAAVVAVMSCNSRKHDLAYYEHLVDSIRKAETLKELNKHADSGPSDATIAWFDTLQLRTLPVRNAGEVIERLGSFSKVPMSLNHHFNYPVSSKLRAIALPERYKNHVIMLAEMRDSITPDIFLFTMDKRYIPLDQLTIYEKRKEYDEGDEGETFTEYFITSNYEITLMRYYQAQNESKEPILIDSRRYIINKEGHFEETLIEL